MTNHRYRPVALAALAAASVAILAGCAAGGGPAPSAAPEGEPVAGGELVHEFWPDLVSCIDPFQVFWIEHRSIIRNFADSLTDQDPETGDVVPWLATDWTISDDGLVYTFELRDDVTFADGAEFNADAVVTAFENHKKTVAEVPGVFGASYIAGYDSSTALDDYTVEIRLSTPNAAFLQATSTTNLALLSPASYETTPEERCLGDIVGSGPFVLDSYVPNEEVTLSKREGYNWASELNAHQGEAYLDTVRVGYVAEDSVRVGNLTSGASDIAWPRNPFTPEQIALLESNGATVHSRSLPGPSSVLYPNVADGKVLSELAVRQAVIKAIDRETYAATIYGADYPVVDGVFDVTTPHFVGLGDQLAFDPEGAAELLDGAGWILEDGATYRTRDGETLTILQPITADNPGDALLQDQLKQLGIDLQLSVFTNADRPSIIANGEYDLLGTYFTRGDPSVLQFILDERYAASVAMAVNAATPEVAAQLQELFDRGREETDFQRRGEIWAEVQQLVHDEGVSFPIFERVQLTATAPNVHGFRFTSEAFASWYDVWKSGE